MKRYYPLFLDLEDQRVVVVGGGELAREKARDLRAAGADVELVEVEAYDRALLAGARLVVDASGDEAVNARVWREAEAQGILVNVVDRPHQCRFIAPAVVRRPPLQVAISTAGESPYLASALRRWLELLLGEEWGPFTSLMGTVRRRLRARAAPLPIQMATYRRLFNSPVRSLLADGRAAEAEARAEAIAARAEAPHVGRVALVGAGPGDPGLLTMRAAALLAEADLVLHDALVSEPVLRLIGRQAEVVPVGKRRGRTQARQDEICRRMIAAAQDGRDVVRLKGGDPFLFGRGGEELAALLAAGVPVEVVPGVTAATSVPAAAGIPLTMRGVASSVALVTGTEAGGAGPGRLAELAAAADTLVVLMPLYVLDSLVSRLLPIVGADRPAALVAQGTLPQQRMARARLADIAAAAREAGIEAPATLIVGRVVTAVAEAVAAVRSAESWRDRVASSG